MGVRKPVLIFDTSAINGLADDRDSAALMAGIQTAFMVRLTAQSVAEIIATTDAGRRDRLLSVCQALLRSGECIQHFNEIIKHLLCLFDSGAPFQWDRVDIRAHDAEDAVVRRELNDDILSSEQRDLAKKTHNETLDIFDPARAAFEQLVSNGVPRPKTFSELVAVLQQPGGAFWIFYGADFYKRAAGHRPDEETVQKLTAACPPFRAFLLAICMMRYEHCTRDLSVGESYRAGAVDLFMSVYLPYCDHFVTRDAQQERCLREIVAEGALTAEIRSYETFRDTLTCGLMCGAR